MPTYKIRKLELINKLYIYDNVSYILYDLILISWVIFNAWAINNTVNHKYRYTVKCILELFILKCIKYN